VIIYVSDFDISGSGYATIGTNLCYELVTKYDIGVVALGLTYRGEEHNQPYTIAPIRYFSEIVPAISEIVNSGVGVKAVVVAIDVPQHIELLKALEGMSIPYIGVFPLEAPPLTFSWAISLIKMASCLVMTKFAHTELMKQGVVSEFIPLAVGNIWKPAKVGEKALLREALGYEEDTIVILTIADNQERKHLSRTAEIVSDFAVKIEKRNEAGYPIVTVQKRKVIWNVVTRVDSPVGWDLNDLVERNGLNGVVRFFNRGESQQGLLDLYQASDCFLLTSKAEGLAIPVLEAMKCRVPVIGTDCTAFTEHLSKGRGFLISVDYVHIDPFGNGKRYFASRKNGVERLEKFLEQTEKEKEMMLDKAESYVNKRTWEKAAKILVNELQPYLK